MIDFGMALGMSGQAFMGTAGIGDMIATATSDKSRNFTFGMRFAQGESLEKILATSDEVIEGLRTLKIVYTLANNEGIILPITKALHRVIFDGNDINAAIDYLIKFQYANDVDYGLEKLKR